MSNAGAYSVELFADEHGISRSQSYEEIKTGRLRSMLVGRRRLISTEAAADWRKLMEAKAKAAAEAVKEEATPAQPAHEPAVEPA